MPELICPVPMTGALLRDEYQYDGQKGHGDYTDCVLTNVSSIQGRPLLFQALTNQGVLRDHLPITAFCWKPCEALPLDDAQLWSCFSYHCVCHTIEYLKDLRVKCVLKDSEWRPGTYQFTFDWHSSPMAEDPGEASHKSANFIALDDGNYVALPNNRILWSEPSFITRPLDTDKIPRFKTNTRRWLTERCGKWEHTADNDDFFLHYTEGD